MIKKRLVSLLSDSKKYIGWNIFWQWIALITTMLMVGITANLIEKAFHKELNMVLLVSSALALLLTVIARFFCDKNASKASYNASKDVKQLLRERIYEKMLRLGSSYKEQVSSSEVVQVSVEGVEQLEIYFGKYLPQLIYSMLAPVTLFLVLSFINIKVSVILMICVPLIPVSIMMVQKLAKKLLNKYWGIYTELGDSFLENLQGLTTLKIYRADKKKAEEMDEESERFRKATMRVLTMQLNSVSAMDLIAYGGAAVGMIVTAREYLAGEMSLSGAIMIILLASEFFLPVRLLGSYFHIAMNGMAASDKIFKILDFEEPADGALKLDGRKTDIKLAGVSFSYNEERKILKDVSLDIPSGSLVSLVGESGCGKSTIASIIMGKNKGYQGVIKIGDIELENVSEKSLMSKITLVTHNSYLFKGTVEENLKMGNPGATIQQMHEVLEKVNIMKFLASRQGLGTQLLEKASNLSGGQCQRLALARALLHDTDIYIFDEASSNIDVESEEQIMEVICELAKTKTVLLISHRLQNVVKSDCIYVVENGCLTESGTHGELVNRAGAYAKLYHTQQQLESYGSFTDEVNNYQDAGRQVRREKAYVS